MTGIIYIGMDVHTTNYTLCAYSMESGKIFGQTTIRPDIKELVKYLETIYKMHGGKYELYCGYEAGCLGYTLYHQLQDHGYSCVILAPTTMPSSPASKKKKNDKRDALNIAKSLAYGTYSAVYVPTAEDNAVKEYIRMRDDAKTMVKQTKQQIVALCTRHGKRYSGKSNWTQAHMTWLGNLEFGNPILQETLGEYIATLNTLTEKLERMDKRIEDLARQEVYAEQVKQLCCFKGIATHTALSLIVEIGDFHRFPTAERFASFLGLVPGEHSSGDSQNRFGITKAGNSHLRRLLTEAANTFHRGCLGKKSATLKARQAGNKIEIIAYADRANDRLRRKYLRIAMRSRANIAKTAVARELACFVWGMMTGKIA